MTYLPIWVQLLIYAVIAANLLLALCTIATFYLPRNRGDQR